MSEYNNTTGCWYESVLRRRTMEPVVSRAFRAILMATIVAASLVENTIVCRVIYRFAGRKPFAHHLMANLAIAELISTFSYPFIFHYEWEPWSWVFGTFMCYVANPMWKCCNAVVTFTMAALAVYRCVIMMWPLQLTKISPSLQRAVLISSWLYSLAIALPSAIKRKEWALFICNHGVIRRCDMFLPSLESRAQYSLTFFLLKHIIPFVVMVTAYGIVAVKVNKHVRRMSSQEVEQPSLSNNADTTLSETAGYHEFQITHSPTADSSQDNPGQELRMRQREQDLLRIIYAIILIYFLCYLPYSVMFMSRELNVAKVVWESEYSTIIGWYQWLLSCLPSALHPMCYLMMRGIHRKELKNLLFYFSSKA